MKKILIIFAVLIAFASCERTIDSKGWEFTVLDTTHVEYSLGTVEYYGVIIEVNNQYYSAKRKTSGGIYSVDRKLHLIPCDSVTYK